MEVRKIPIEDIHPAEYNARVDLQPGDPAYEKIKASIKEFDSVVPLVWNKRTGNLVGGHQRLKILKARGDKEIEVSVVDLPEDKEKILNLGLNKIGGSWDMIKVEELLKDSEFKPEDLKLTGFDEDEIEGLTSKWGIDERFSNKGREFLGADDAMQVDDVAAEIFKGATKIFCQYSGGKDSSFSLIWARKNFPNIKTYCFFSDPGVEFPGMQAHIQAVCKYFDCEMIVARPKTDPFLDMLKWEQWPSIIFRPCQGEWIHGPINALYHQHGPEGVVLIDGSRAEEATARSSKSKTSKLPHKKLEKFATYHPAFDVKKEEEEKVIAESGIPLWEGYEQGFIRTACYLCPGQCSAQAYALQRNYPGLANVVRRWEEKLGLMRPLDGKGFDHLCDHGKVLYEKEIAKAKLAAEAEERTKAREQSSDPIPETKKEEQPIPEEIKEPQ